MVENRAMPLPLTHPRCPVPRYARAVLFTSLLLVAATSSAQTPRTGKTRVYYIAADEVLWNYAPAGRDVIGGTPFRGPQEMWTKRGPTTIGTTYKKALFREYTDGTFSTLKARPTEWEHMGFLGPVIRAEVGDSIRVVFRNNGSHPFSVHPHGVIYDKDSEGAPYADGTSGRDKQDDGVAPGANVHLPLVRERALGADVGRAELGNVDVPFARPGRCGCERGAHWGVDRDGERAGETGRVA